MSKRNQRAKWVLPQVINPPKKICFQIQVPDERYHIAAFMGALYNLTSAIFWSDDTAHTAKEVARVWQDIYDNIRRQCVTEFINTYVSLEDDMPFFREVCENSECFLEFQCCPGEWVRLGNANKIPAGTSPSAGTPQPASGGGVVVDCQSMQANNVFLIGAPLNTGDTLSIQASGSGNDGGEIQWRCPDGSTYFGGVCNAAETRLDAGDPVPSVNHMSLIINIGGVFHAVGSGVYTVPTGVSNAQSYLQVNDSDITNNKGSYQICVTHTNNQASAWCHLWNLALADGGWAINPTECGHWNPGVGWVSDPCPGTQNLTVHYEFLSAPVLTDFEVVFSGAGAGSWQIFIYDFNTATNLGVDSGSLPLGNISHIYSHIGSVVAGHHIWIVAYLDNAGGALINSTVKGIGASPFGSSNC